MYVGFSCQKLEALEDNHRNWRSKKDHNGKPYKGRPFRVAVEQHPEWEFRWIVPPAQKTEARILKEEGYWIHEMDTAKHGLNVDLYPSKKSWETNYRYR